MQNNTFNEYFARGQFYDMIDGKKTLCVAKDAFVVLAAGTANQTVVNGVTGKSLVILHGQVNSLGAAGTLLLNSNVGGNRKGFNIPANSAAEPTVFFGGQKWGYMRTNSSQAIVADTTGAAGMWLSITYIEVTA